jgi:hypothetical protein
LGSLHPDTADCLHNLAELYHRQEAYKQAAALYKRVLAIYELTLSLEHPQALRAFMDYITLLQQQVAQMWKRLDEMRVRLQGSHVNEEG